MRRLALALVLAMALAAASPAAASPSMAQAWRAAERWSGAEAEWTVRFCAYRTRRVVVCEGDDVSEDWFCVARLAIKPHGWRWVRAHRSRPRLSVGVFSERCSLAGFVWAHKG